MNSLDKMEDYDRLKQERDDLILRNAQFAAANGQLRFDVEQLTAQELQENWQSLRNVLEQTQREKAELERKLAEQQSFIAQATRAIEMAKAEQDELLAQAREEGRKEALPPALVAEIKSLRKSLISWRTARFPEPNQADVVDRDYPLIAMLAAAPTPGDKE